MRCDPKIRINTYSVPVFLNISHVILIVIAFIVYVMILYLNIALLVVISVITGI